MNRSRLAALSAGAMFLLATVFTPIAALAAGTGSLSISPNTVNTTTGSVFSVDITSQASNAMGGASAGIDFDNTKLQIVSVAQPALGTGWNVAGTSWVLPSVATIGTANSTGHLPAIAVFFADGTSSLPAATATTLARVTFFATAAGSPVVSIPTTGVNAAAILDGAAASYGSPVAVTTTGSTVTIASDGNSNTAITTDVTGSVDAGYVSLTCPGGVVVPLVRNVVNVKEFTCQVGSNVTWTMSTKDNNPVANHGHLIDAAQASVAALTDSLHVVSVDHNVDLSGAGLQTLATGQNNSNQLLTFSQNVRPGDKPGSYGMSVLFSITSTF